MLCSECCGQFWIYLAKGVGLAYQKRPYTAGANVDFMKRGRLLIESTCIATKKSKRVWGHQIFKF